MKSLIINADDLGICQETNSAIAEAHRNGCLTSASLLANGEAFDHACDLLAGLPQLGVGLHFNLTSGRSVASTKQVPLLVDSQGRLKNSFVTLLKASWTQQEFLKQVGIELQAQLDRLSTAGVKVTHVDGHQHIQMIPAIFGIVGRMAAERLNGRIRFSRERLWPRIRSLRWHQTGKLIRNYPKQLVLNASGWRNHRQDLQTVDQVVGILDSGLVDSCMLSGLLNKLPDGITEVITHPSHPVAALPSSYSQADHEFLSSPNRIREFQALLDPAWLQSLETSDVRLVNYETAWA